ncbi:unnamed protein product [Rhizophagus irregularis]|uniref:Wax synthase domain-containing protein n=2 Tax=Rhizophagus irregularis TaxID=588596 RepID=A0A2I1EY04_9GLOM|nr:hypothetical protein RhiirB3_477421 [Rhizophagus irregularis]CAB4493957.1 unnamed protein product [Rhizophagus irregularis]CAB5099652.1 unnamed protein product [Rhizophagus irregularis]CAB5353715.1 unnamed protein product [Rhizophagus irregularis]
MSLESQSRIFTKPNLVYIPLSITIAHTLNFIINSPLSIWQEFPPKLPNSIYFSISIIPLLLFISLTFEPIRTRKRFYTLLSLALIYISIPISFRKGNYPIKIHNGLVTRGAFFGMKMFLFLKLNRTYKNPKNSKEFTSFFWTLFNWRFDSYIIPPKSENDSLIIKSPTTSQINKKLINRSIITFLKWLIFELTLFISNKYEIKIPEKAYQVRLIEFIIKGTPLITSSILLYLNSVISAYLAMSIIYDIFTIIFTIFFRLFLYSKSENSNHKSILIKSGLFTPSEYVSLKEWMITFLFNTKHIFSMPWIASSPRDFWSTRWQLMFSEIFKELGYLPVRNLLITFVPRKIANMMGVLGALCFSSLLHEYLIIGISNIWTGEHFFFFMIHGVIFILWEIVFGYEKKNEITKIKRFLKWILLLTINLMVLPAFVEPMIRKNNILPKSYLAKYYTNN